MLLLDHEEAIASEYFNFSNDVIGIFAIGLSAAALQFQHPEPFAWFFLGIISIWGFGKGGRYRKIAKNYVKKHKGFIGTIVLLWRIKIFIIGAFLLTSIGYGLITEEGIYAFLGY